MTSRQPSRRLVDVLRQNSLQALRKNANELACANQALRAENIQTRFLRNAFLIPPQSLCLLQKPPLSDTLTSWHMFALYKPPFCPMRRAQAGDNYHRVSVESFVAASLRSRAVWPTLRQLLQPQEVHVRVLYDLDTFASGPVVVRVSDTSVRSITSLPVSLHHAVMEYDVMVAGHLPIGVSGDMDPTELFPDSNAPADNSGPAAPAHSSPATRAHTKTPTAHSCSPIHGHKPVSSASSLWPPSTRCSYEVCSNGYYRVHGVSMLTVRLVRPPTAKPPAIAAYIRQHLGTYVMGDPHAMREVVQGTGNMSHALPDASDAGVRRTGMPFATQSRAPQTKLNQGVIALRGDCDFPRVFLHLRSVTFTREGQEQEPRNLSDARGTNSHCAQSTRVTSAAAAAVRTPRTDDEARRESSVLRFHCNKCFESILKGTQPSSMKERQLSILDGTWTTASEHMA